MDNLYWYPVSKFPNIAAAIRKFPDPPTEQAKPVKNALTGSLGQIALLSMDNKTGLITWLIAKAKALGKEELIYQLVPQLQAAVDSLKGATPPDAKLINGISRKLKAPVEWLEEYKAKWVFIKHPFGDQSREDTISQLVTAVSSLWIPNNNKVTNVRGFLPLFDEPSEKYIQRAVARCKEYATAITDANSCKLPYLREDKTIPVFLEDKVDAEISLIKGKFKHLLDSCTPEQKLEAVAAFWRVRHWYNQVESNTNICFRVGIDEICTQLSQLRIKQIHLLNKNNPEYAEEIFNGESIVFRLVEFDGHIHAFDMNECCIGALPLSQYPPVMIGEWCKGTFYTKYDSKNKPCDIRVTIEEVDF